jgi:hypothetical protein
MAGYKGDIVAGTKLYFVFNTRDSSQVPITLAGSPSVAVFDQANVSLSPSSGPTLTVDYNSKTGSHQVAVDTSVDGTFYSAGKEYSVKISAGTVSGNSVVGVEVGSFSIENRTQKADLRKIAGQTASASGTVTFPAATLASTTNITAASGVAVSTNSDKTGYSLTQSFPANFSSLAITAGGSVTVGTNLDKTGYSLTQTFPANFSSLSITAGGLVTVGTNSDKTGYSLTQTFPSNFSSLGISASGHITTVDTVANGVTVATNGDKTGYSLTVSPPTASAIATAVWQDTTAADFAVANSIGKSLYTSGNAPGAASGLALVGSTVSAPSGYAFLSTSQAATVPTSGTINTTTPPTVTAIRTEMDTNSTKLANLDAAVSSRLATSGYTAPPTAAQNAAAILKTPANLIGTNSDNTVQIPSTATPPTTAQIAAALFVDGGTNKLKVNSDNSVNASSSGTSVVVSNVIPAAAAIASQVPSQIGITTYNTLRVTLPLMGDISSRTSLIFTIKKASTDADSAALIQISESGGLLIANGATASNASYGSLSVTNASTGAVNLYIHQSITALLTSTNGIADARLWDCIYKTSTDHNPPIGGKCIVTAGITRT